VTAFVVDTNVLVTANKKAEQASPRCVITCVEQLELIEEHGSIAVDDRWLILNEYMKNASSTGQPGAGDRFLRWVLSSRSNEAIVEWVHITPRGGSGEDFEEFPADPDLATFDPSDRKFVAVALASKHQPPILNATDSDWWSPRVEAALKRHGVEVIDLCPDMKAAHRSA
jgi:hypothetical protein